MNKFFCTLMIKILSDLSDIIQLCISCPTFGFDMLFHGSYICCSMEVIYVVPWK